MISRRTRLLLAITTLVSGVLAGGIVDRALVGAPPWRALGEDAWAQYSVRPDLGRGLIAYPLEGIGAAILIIATTVSFHMDRSVQPRVKALLYLAIASSLSGLLFTVKAAPIMLALGAHPASIELSHAFIAFHFWGLYLRGATDLLAFVVEVLALAAMGQRGLRDATLSGNLAHAFRNER